MRTAAGANHADLFHYSKCVLVSAFWLLVCMLARPFLQNVFWADHVLSDAIRCRHVKVVADQNVLIDRGCVLYVFGIARPEMVFNKEMVGIKRFISHA